MVSKRKRKNEPKGGRRRSTKEHEGARSRHSTRPYRDLRRFRACPQHRTQATLERSKVYWSWPLLLQAQGQRGNSHIRMTSRPHRLKKTSSMQSKRRDLHHTWLHRETNEKLSFYCYSPRWITLTFFTKRAQSTPNIIVNTGSKKSVSSVLVKRDNLKQM